MFLSGFEYLQTERRPLRTLYFVRKGLGSGLCQKCCCAFILFLFQKRKKSIFFYFFRDRDKRHFGTFGTTGGEHLLGDGGKILLCAAVSGLGAKVDSGPTEQVEEAAVGYPRALETEAAGVLGIALSGA